MSSSHHWNQKKAHLECAFFWFYTGTFFNNVNQAESLDFSSTLTDPSGFVGGEKNP
jgi:hypothetical protein